MMYLYAAICRVYIDAVRVQQFHFGHGCVCVCVPIAGDHAPLKTPALMDYRARFLLFPQQNFRN